VIKRDYIERLVQQAVQAIAQALELVSAGQFDPALLLLKRTSEAVLGPLAQLVDRLDPASAVALAGRFEADRIRLYAALLGEQSLIQELRHHHEEAASCARRGLELYAAASMAGLKLMPGDHDRMARLIPLAGRIDPRYEPEAQRLAALATNID
jgi:hypothetical protein